VKIEDNRNKNVNNLSQDEKESEKIKAEIAGKQSGEDNR
jgi:hypothetical protein